MKAALATLVLFISGILLSCSQKAYKNTAETTNPPKASVKIETQKSLKKDNQPTSVVYFKASGTEPFWRLEISEDRVKLLTIDDSLITPHTAPIRAMDANVKLYKTKTESVELSIQIVQSECTNEMSGMVSPYTVSVKYKKSIDIKPTELKGCGQYITDYRLNDIWVLEKMKGSKITKQDYSKELRMVEIHTTSNTFSGFAGCNQMTGSLFYEKGMLRFTNVVTTKMTCESSMKEAEFLKQLQSSIAYKIENNRLTLSNSGTELLIFKKID